MSKIYLPTEYLNKPCYVINADYIRVYNTVYTNQNNVVYDIYIKQDYMIRQTTATYTSNTLCDRFNTYTDDFYYRTDIDKILIVFLILAFCCLWLPFKLFMRLFRRFTLR